MITDLTASPSAPAGTGVRTEVSGDGNEGARCLENLELALRPIRRPPYPGLFITLNLPS